MRRLLLAFLALMALGLSACSGGQAAAPQTGAQPAGTPAAGTQAAPAITLTTEQKFLLGTLKLTGPAAVTKDQAVRLLPLWQGLRDANQQRQPGGDTDSQIKIDELTAQISAAMTPDQLKAIDGMNIGRETLTAIMREWGLLLGPGDGGFPQGGDRPQMGDGAQPPQGMPQFGGQGGAPAGGQFRGRGGQGGGQPPTGMQPPADGQAPADGQRPNWAGGRGLSITPELYDVVIQVLQQAAG